MSAEGPRLALVFLLGLVLVAVVFFAAASGDAVIGGAGMAVLGSLIALGSRELAEVFRHLSWPPLPWVAWVAVGLIIAAAGVIRIVSA